MSVDADTPFRLETERLILRDWTVADREPFLRHTNTPEVMRWLGGVLDDSRAGGMIERLDAYRRDFGFTFWVVERKDDGGLLSGEILGFCGLKRANLPPGPLGDMEIGWRFREDAWGQGYAKEAALAAMRAGFERFKAPHMIALTVLDNTPSWGLMLRLGMERREDLDFAAEGDAAWARNIAVWSITRRQWEENR
ncbi:GNAT family N-acetyltransferase [Croceicoccus marinus]|jgi:RimJ/RimL family protein N-acetyltransferase|uniref:GNAT family N-acetyltransferase n=1 Tax=Croceicoccus marinus TaxID=450378 RepID=A0A7G6VV28_9SPHN|nr:GNAT family N-acetyltransferase [Croceicoccus marinus]QNE05593.1 GNAT family N-acetyltransferase [Croceicoccus marinus]